VAIATKTKFLFLYLPSLSRARARRRCRAGALSLAAAGRARVERAGGEPGAHTAQRCDFALQTAHLVSGRPIMLLLLLEKLTLNRSIDRSIDRILLSRAPGNESYFVSMGLFVGAPRRGGSGYLFGGLRSTRLKP
jgi:hypothetical protein